MVLPTLLVAGSLKLPAGVPPSQDTPLAYIQSWLRQRMPEFGGRGAALADRVLIVRAETGSGKSTVLPVGVFRILRAEATPARLRYRGPGVICTQPRVLTAIMLARDVAVRRNPDMVVGETVGFQTGAISTPRATGLTYATAGVLAAQLNTMADSEVMEAYRFIIVDEAHERSVDADFILMQLRYFYQRNAGDSRLPFLILASATFQPARYAAYFGVGVENTIDVQGRSYPITTHWPPHGFNNYTKSAAELAAQIHSEHPEDEAGVSDILIFMPGAREQEEVALELKRLQRDALASSGTGAAHSGAAPDGAAQTYLVLVLNREVVLSQVGDYLLAFMPAADLPRIHGQRPQRRIILSTVVAETGITFNTLRYVIDSGWNRNVESYPPWGATGNITRPAPQSRITQRRGRCGRLFPGDFYPLYTQSVYRALPAQQLPDIVSQGVSSIFLPLVAAQLRQKLLAGAPPEFRVEDVALLDPPPPEVLLSSLRASLALGLLSPEAPRTQLAAGNLTLATAADKPVWGLTELGLIASKFIRTRPEATRLLLAGYTWGVAASDLLTAAAMFGQPLTMLYVKGSRPDAAAPLLAALPPTLRTIAPTLGGGEKATAADATAYSIRLLLADDFAEAILIFDEFARRLAAAAGSPAAAAEWCADSGLSFDAMVKLAIAREELAEELAAAGLNPSRLDAARLAAVSAAEFTPTLRRLKRCLFDGLQANLMRLAPDGVGYVQHAQASPLRARAPPLFTDSAADRLAALGAAASVQRPRWLITDGLRLVAARKNPVESAAPLMYGIEMGLMSVLDGYVDFDPDALLPRSFSAD